MIGRAFREEHGYVCPRTPHDPPPIKETVEFPVRVRYEKSLSGENIAPLTIKTSTAILGATAYKVKKVSCWVTAVNQVELTVTEVEAGTTSVKATDRAGRNHDPSCSVHPPQDDWFQFASGAVNYYNIIVTPSGLRNNADPSFELVSFTVDVVYILRLSIPIQTVALQTSRPPIEFIAAPNSLIALPPSQITPS